jgi:hypothetical protein
MTSALKVAAVLAALGILLLGPLGNSPGQEKKSPLPREITWKLKALNQDPLKLVRTQYDPKKKAAFWVLELVRDLDVYEDGIYWQPEYLESRRPRFRFELQDENGIVLKTVDCRYVGEYVNKAGKRFGALLELPEKMSSRIKAVEAVGVTSPTYVKKGK